MGCGEEDDAESGPGDEIEGCLADGFLFEDIIAHTRDGGTDEKNGPREKGEEKDGDVIPEWLDVLEFRSEVALEVVFDDEDAKEVWIAAGAEDVPRESGEAEGDDGDGVKEAENVAPLFGEQSPEKDGAAGED